MHSSIYSATLLFSSDTNPLTASFIHVYSITSTTPTHTQSLTILPPTSNSTNYRGDTLRLHPPTTNSHPPPINCSRPPAVSTQCTNATLVYSTSSQVLPSGLLNPNEETIERWQTPFGGESEWHQVEGEDHRRRRS